MDTPIVNYYQKVGNIELKFDAIGKITKGTAKKLRLCGLRYCPKCKEIYVLERFNGRKYCVDCKRKDDRVRATRWRSEGGAANVPISKRRSALKKKIVKMMGGRCSRCGYNESLAALDFHHVGEKTERVGTLIHQAACGNKEYLSALYAEVEQCMLLCSNCHRTLHFDPDKWGDS